MIKPIISFIVIEYFSIDEVKNFISSLKSNISSIEHEIIISSNSCYDEKLQVLARSSIPNAEWIFNKKNGGFAYGINQGLKIANGKYLVISNPDVIISNGLESMVKFMDDHYYIGAVGPQIIDKNGFIQDNCRKYVNVLRFLVRQFRRYFKNEPIIYERDFNYSLVQTVDWLSGSFIMVRREVYIKTNGLDEKYFLYAEDLDWCTRIRQAGYEIVYFPEMKIFFSGSRKARKKLVYALIFIKSHIRYWSKFGFFSEYPMRKNIVFN